MIVFVSTYAKTPAEIHTHTHNAMNACHSHRV